MSSNWDDPQVAAAIWARVRPHLSSLALLVFPHGEREPVDTVREFVQRIGWPLCDARWSELIEAGERDAAIAKGGESHGKEEG